MKLTSLKKAVHKRTRMRRAEPGSQTPPMPWGSSSGRPPQAPSSDGRVIKPLVLWLLLLGGVRAADDWPQWLGPQRDAVWRESGIVEKFSADGPPVRWRTPAGIRKRVHRPGAQQANILGGGPLGFWRIRLFILGEH